MKLENIKDLSLKEKLELAYYTTDSILLENLAKDPNSSIRRLVAKSKDISKKTINSLSRDPVLNVSYIACNNPLSDITRDFDNVDHPCIRCDKDERFLDCDNCDSLKKYYNI